MLFDWLTTILGLLLGLLVAHRLMRERRTPGNVMAWFFFILLLPYLGVALYFIFGGRKYRRLVAAKRRVREAAECLAGDENTSFRTNAGGAAHFPTFSGNRFSLLPNGFETFHRLLQHIEDAKDSIHLTTYIFTCDETGQHIFDALVDAAHRGVNVRILVDGVGSRDFPSREIKRLKAANGAFVRFMPMLPLRPRGSFNLRNHRKVATFDGRVAITGGQNIDKRFMGEAIDQRQFIDFSAEIEGPAVSMFERDFLSDWCFASGVRVEDQIQTLPGPVSPVGDVDFTIVSSGPDHSRDYLWEQIVMMIQDCRDKLIIVTPYLVPDEVLLRSLIVKARAGRNVRLVLPEHSNHPFVDAARLRYLRALHASGVTIQLHRGPVLHGKLMLVDGNTSLFGSANLDQRSLFLNFETAVISCNPVVYGAFDNWIAAVQQNCIPFEKSPIASPKARNRLLEDIAQLTEPLL